MIKIFDFKLENSPMRFIMSEARWWAQQGTNKTFFEAKLRVLFFDKHL
ncbi:hypothetical protein RED65_11969 [Oceanobacter sp. RED65]|uniref:Uncharacterized protein n=1 Tax=Bermanella marisrubri TaxID=207949 RepID=Q1N3T9_9GAMM|nr:hypothetical protein RED65_11969 [Oceanobacter sp. RED65] [Bermanella marisrubri]